MVKACISVTVTNIVLMASAGILYLLISDMLGEGLRTERIPVYVIGGVSVLILIYITNFIQYNATFLSTYKESGVRRTVLAERLRKLPLSFFGKKDLSDLTTTIMSDCAMIETASSHWIPELIGALISTAIVGVSMFFFFDWRMVLASFWVIPASFLMGYNTLIGENGSELSGGERQRISIARAFLKDAPIILLDEATASLDVDNETKVQAALSRLIKDKTVMVIAHRMRTVAGADKIVVLSDGVVAEQGTPDELLQKNGIFAQMARLQTEGQNWSIA